MDARYSGFLPAGGSFDSAGEYVTDCPVCLGRRKLYWNPVKQAGRCFGGKPVPCQVRVRGESDYRKLFEGHHEATGIHLTPRADYSAKVQVEDEALVSVTDPWAHSASRSFLSGEPPKGRGLSRDVVRRSGMGGDGRRIWIDLDPVVSRHPSYRYVRSADGSGPWIPKQAGVRRTSYVYGLRHWLRDEPWGQVVIFEGVFDVLGTDLIGRALALMGSSLSTDLARFLSEHGVVQAYYWPDPDPAGQDGARKAASVLSGWGVECSVVDTVDKPELNPKFVPPAEARKILGRLGWSE